jgi:hypothetical protein
LVIAITDLTEIPDYTRAYDGQHEQTITPFRQLEQRARISLNEGRTSDSPVKFVSADTPE